MKINIKKILPIIVLIIISTTLLFGQKNFENKNFGFSIQEPKDWIVAANKELIKNFEKLDFTDENLVKIFQNEKQFIFLTAFIKYDVNEHAGLIPKIQVSVLPQNTKDFQQFKVAITKTANNLKNFIEGYELIQEPKEIEISGIKSVYFLGKLTVKTQKGMELKSRNRILAIPYKNYFFQISFVDEEIGENSSELFDALVKTIKIGK